MKSLKKILMGIVAAGMLAASSLFVVSPAFAQTTCPAGSLRAGTSVSNPTECNLEKTTEGSGDLMSTVKKIIVLIISVLGIVAVIVIIISGVMYMTSMGDAGKVKTAKNTMMYAVVGLVIAILAYAIVNFVLGNVF